MCRWVCGVTAFLPAPFTGEVSCGISMKRILQKIIPLLILILLLSSQGEAVEYRGELDLLARDFYSSGETEEILDRMAREEEKLLLDKKDYQTLTSLAEIEIFRGEIKEVAGLTKPDQHFQAAFDLSQRALEIEKGARAKRLAAEALSRLFNYRSTFFVIRNGSKALNYMEGAVELEPENNMKQLVLGNYYFNAPAIGGGDESRGREIFEEIMEAEHPVFNFLILNFLASLDTDAWEEYLAAARKIFPDSPWTGKIF